MYYTDDIKCLKCSGLIRHFDGYDCCPNCDYWPIFTLKKLPEIKIVCEHNRIESSFSNAICSDCGEEVANWSPERIR